MQLSQLLNVLDNDINIVLEKINGNSKLNRISTAIRLREEVKKQQIKAKVERVETYDDNWLKIYLKEN